MRKVLRQMMFLWVVMTFLFTYAAEYTPGTVPNPKKDAQDNYVVNPDNILSDDDVQFLNACSSDLEKQTQVEMCVAALENIGDADCFDFAYELYQRWGIGKKGKNTGVLILFVLDSHDIRIMTGTGIEGVLTDARCSKIIHDDMIPSFKDGNYGEGLCYGALAIYEECTGGEAPEELLNMTSVTNRGRYDDSGDEDTDWVTIVIIALIILFIIYVLSRGSKSGGKGSGYSGGGFTGHSGGSFSSGGGFSSGRSWGGGSTSGGGAGGKW